MAEKFPSWMKAINPQEAQWTLNKRNKKITPRYIIIILLKTSDKKKIIKQLEQKTCYVQRNKHENENRLITGNNAIEKTVQWHLKSAEKNTLVNLEFYAWWKYLPQLRWNKLSWNGKRWKNLLLEDLHYRVY